MTHSQALKVLGSKDAKKVDNNTYLHRIPGIVPGTTDITLSLHGHTLITWYANGDIRLTSAGWRTVTTKDRLNKFGPVSVYQKNYAWYTEDNSPFEDGMLIEA